tara:strand:- start:89 stop:256 length:168 start_codon:yes stop_codon:yes gene_type:complete
MKLKALKDGTFPSGVHWSKGECRDIASVGEVDLPSWLVEVKESKPEKKKKAASKG